MLGACATLALGAAAVIGPPHNGALRLGTTWGNDYQCREGGWIELSKYTITTSSPELDAEFAMRVFGATDQLTGGDEGADDDTTNLEDPSTYWDCNGKVHIRKLAFGAVKPMELHFRTSAISRRPVPWTSSTGTTTKRR